MSLVCINVTKYFFCRVVFFPADFSAGRQTCLVAWTSFMPLDRFAARLKKTLEKKLHDWKKFGLHLCKPETCTYISLAAMYGLTAIDNILVAGWKHASFLCYSMGVRWFLRFLGPKLELPRSSAYSPYLRCLCTNLWKGGSIILQKCDIFSKIHAASVTSVLAKLCYNMISGCGYRSGN